jgi:hypothetical protein
MDWNQLAYDGTHWRFLRMLKEVAGFQKGRRISLEDE